MIGKCSRASPIRPRPLPLSDLTLGHGWQAINCMARSSLMCAMLVKRSEGSALMSTCSATAMLATAMSEAATAARDCVETLELRCQQFGPSNICVSHQAHDLRSKVPDGDMQRGAPGTWSVAFKNGTVVASC